MEELENKTNVPNILKRYEQVSKCTIPFYHCENCGHGYIENILSDNFYEEFTVALDDKSDGFRDNIRNIGFNRIIDRLLEISHNDNDSILEIGAGRGYLLKQASKRYKYAFGVEPSKVEAAFAQSLGLNIMIDFFGKHNNIERKFSAFVSTMVFEHLPDPKEAITYAYELLKDGGSGVIQVPNAQRTVVNKVYFDVYPQHLHYYTPLSLAKLVTDAGFEILSLEETSERNYLEVYIRKPLRKTSFKQKEMLDRNFFDANTKEYQCVGLWGASYAARSCIYLLEQTNIKHFFDVSDSKIGGYINDCGVEIEYPEIDKVCGCDLLIITANEYTNEIVTSLKNKYHYVGDIIYFDDTCNLLKEKLG